MISIERINHEEDYEVYVGYRQNEINTLNNYPWFLVRSNYNNGIFVKKDVQWYYRNVCEDLALFSPQKPTQTVLDAYDELIKKEIKNFIYNSILIQHWLIPDVMNYIKTFF
jgi:hypothetical protein